MCINGEVARLFAIRGLDKIKICATVFDIRLMLKRTDLKVAIVSNCRTCPRCSGFRVKRFKSVILNKYKPGSLKIKDYPGHWYSRQTVWVCNDCSLEETSSQYTARIKYELRWNPKIVAGVH